MSRARSCQAWMLASVAALLWHAPASAQQDEDLMPSARSFESPETMGIELRIGPYQPDMDGNDAFDTYFADDDGLLLELELDVIAYRIPDILYLNGGGAIGWAKYKGNTITDTGEQASEETDLELVPLSLLAVARLDALSRKLGIPFLFAGKLGYSWVHWTTEAGGAYHRDGWSLGLAYAFQVALDLDWFDLSAARTMDEEWGINRSFFLFELRGFSPNDDSLPVGDFTWSLGLGFTF